MAARSVAVTAAGPRPLDGRRSQLHARKVRVPTDERRAHGHGARGTGRTSEGSHRVTRETARGGRRYGRSIGRTTRTDGGCTRRWCSSNEHRNERGLRTILPAYLMSSSAAPLLVVRWLCSWTEEGRRT